MKAKITLFIFALPFVGVGGWMGAAIGNNLLDAWQMRSWIEVDANLSAAGSHTRRGDDSDSYEVYARYSYSYGGQYHQATRVGIASGADNIGSYHQNLGRVLAENLSRGTGIVVYVDPDNPTNAVIDRALRWGLVGFKSIFFLVFGGVGVLLMYAAFRKHIKIDATAAKSTDQQWKLNTDWQTASIRSQSKAAMYVAWGFAAIWSLISAPLPFVIYKEFVEKSNNLSLIGLLFPLVGIGLIIWAVRRTLEWRRFGPAPVTMDPFPGAIGGHVGGSISINLAYAAANEFSVTLTCLHSYVSGTGKSRSRKETALWQDKLMAHAEPNIAGTLISFRFNVPEHLRESDAAKEERDYHLWRLSLNAILPGTDFNRDYEIPVYATGQQSRRLSALSVERSHAKQAALNASAVSSIINLQHNAGGKFMYFPMGRHVLAGLGGMIFGTIFSGAGWLMIVKAHSLIMGGIFGLVGSIIMLSGFYFVLNSLEVRKVLGGVRTIRRILGIPLKTRELLSTDFLRFSTKCTMKTQSGGKYKMLYSVFAHTRSGERLVVGEGFDGASQADAAVAAIGDAFDLKSAAKERFTKNPADDMNLLAGDA